MLEKNKKPKLIVILGPTASGKSDIAVMLARKFNGEIISADSRQVYKELDIGTGKITKKEMRNIPHHLIDVVSILRLRSGKERFSAANFKKQAEKAIEKILNKNKIPIICGGTGFYIDTLLEEKQIPEVLPNEKLRKELEEKTTEELFEILKKLDPERAKNIDVKNPRRLVRAIEICEALGPNSASNFAQATSNSKESKYDVLKIGITPITPSPTPSSYNKRKGLQNKTGIISLSPLSCYKRGNLGVSYLDEKTLRDHINKRIYKWFKQGLLKEVSDLHKKGLSWKKMSEIGLEYKIVSEYLKNKISRQEMIERMQKETWQYAKRQMTYFKKTPGVIWLPPKINLIEKEVKKFI